MFGTASISPVKTMFQSTSKASKKLQACVVKGITIEFFLKKIEEIEKKYKPKICFNNMHTLETPVYKKIGY